MEELDLLKKNWNRSDPFEQISESDIYKILLKKSSSTVKWILIISIIELLFWTSSNLLCSTDDAFEKLHILNLEKFIIISNVIHYSIVVGFIVSFYKNYKKISVITSTKNLMDSILKTRKTVQYYIWYNLAIIALSFIFGIVLVFNTNPEISKLNQSSNFKYGFIAGFVIVASVFVGLFWILYKLIYGRLLRKLTLNYVELKKIDL